MSLAETPETPEIADTGVRQGIEQAHTRHDPFAALRFRDFRLLVLGSFLAVIAEQMLGVAVGWELYERTRDPLALGLVGLVEIVPVLLLSLPAGQVADRRERKWVVVAAMTGVSACMFGLFGLSLTRGPLPAFYALLFGVGVARAFQSPAFSALSAQVVPSAHYASAATWASGAWQSSAILGPALGGLLLALWGGAAGVYPVAGVLVLVVALLCALLRPRVGPRSEEPVSLSSLLAGARFIRHTPVILAAITLDMFGVLLGGATALLPVFALDILNVGATGLGWLRAAPAVGAVLAALAIAMRPPFRYAGRTLLFVVAGFGLATIIFGLSRDFVLSLAMLALLGGLDNVSVVIRGTLLLTRTPDMLRGRVNAVHSVFVGISNELGAFESGLAAVVLTTVGAVVAGGLGTILVVALVAALAPDLRRLGRLDTHYTN